MAGAVPGRQTAPHLPKSRVSDTQLSRLVHRDLHVPVRQNDRDQTSKGTTSPSPNPSSFHVASTLSMFGRFSSGLLFLVFVPHRQLLGWWWFFSVSSEGPAHQTGQNDQRPPAPQRPCHLSQNLKPRISPHLPLSGRAVVAVIEGTRGTQVQAQHYFYLAPPGWAGACQSCFPPALGTY